MKRTLAWMLCAVLMLMYAAPGMAYNQNEHNAFMKQVLFGDPGYTLYKNRGEAFDDIANALAICIDQFSPSTLKRNDIDKFDELLKEYHLSMSFNDIELIAGKVGESITPNTHRKFTHLGWDYNYKKAEEEELWNDRKLLLQETVYQVLFNDSSNAVSAWLSNKHIAHSGVDPQCDAFCELIYCVHILGDHIEGNEAQSGVLEPLTKYEDPNNPSIITDLQACMPELFANQKNTRIYTSLINDLDMINNDAQALYSTGSSNESVTNKDIADKLLGKLALYVPTLLRNEEFFSDVFL